MLNDRKITDWTQPVSSLDDRPQMTASALKAAFDSNSNQLKPAVNGIIDDLTGTTGAGNIGVEAIAGVTGTTVQAMLAALKALIDLCDTSETVDDKLDLKADKTTTDKLVKTITLDADTGVFTIKTDDDTTTTIDTMLEKIPVNCYLDGQEFVLVLDDGTEQRADLSDFITETEFTDSSTIDFSVTGSNVTATIKNGSITLSMLENTVMSTLQVYMTEAQTAASNAATSETNAGTYRDQAQSSATAATASASEADSHATESESWAVGGTGTRTGEDTNNSKYFAQQSANSAATAQGWSDSAMEQADAAAQSAADAAQSAADAEAIAGGDYIPNSQKGVAGGVATLGSDGKVSSTQLPEMNYIPTSQKGAASGVASLDATGKLEETQKPDYTASEVGAVPTARTVNGKSLSSDVVLTGDDIKTSSSNETTISSQLSNRLRLPIAIPANADLNDYVSPGMYFCSANAQNVANIPPDSITGAFSLFVEKTGAYGNGVKQTFTEHNPGFTYIRLLSDTSMNHWSDWKLIANATPPEGYNLPLSDGISVQDGLSAVYSKNQFGEVVVHGDLVGQMQNGSVIATLPAGFRPIYTLVMPATCDFTAGRIQVNSAGEICVMSQLSECSSLYFLAVFVAGV